MTLTSDYKHKGKNKHEREKRHTILMEKSKNDQDLHIK